jgi:hypothetical protein
MTKIDVEVLENWELLIKKGGDARQYRDASLEDECVFVVVDAIADFGVQHRIGSQALPDYVIGALHEITNRSGDGGDPYYSSEVTRRWTGRTEGVKVRMKMVIVVRKRTVIVTILTSDRVYLFGS